MSDKTIVKHPAGRRKRFGVRRSDALSRYNRHSAKIVPKLSLIKAAPGRIKLTLATVESFALFSFGQNERTVADCQIYPRANLD